MPPVQRSLVASCSAHPNRSFTPHVEIQREAHLAHHQPGGTCRQNREAGAMVRPRDGGLGRQLPGE
jgi:hypothetical protein